jgi:hypothetical protein
MKTKKMDIQSLIPWTMSIFLFLLTLSACAPAPSRTPYLPPPPAQNATPPPTAALPRSTVEPLPPDASCTNDLAFIADLTIPDYTVVAPGSLLDKQWLVQNTGTCNWDSRYRLRYVGGYTLDAPEEQALYPAVAGAQVTIRILFTAPAEAGEYVSIWQAFDPDGLPFGDAFLIKIIVQP